MDAFEFVVLVNIESFLIIRIILLVVIITSLFSSSIYSVETLPLLESNKRESVTQKNWPKERKKERKKGKNKLSNNNRREKENFPPFEIDIV